MCVCVCVCVCMCMRASECESRTPFHMHKLSLNAQYLRELVIVASKGLVPGSRPGEFSIVCIGTAFPVIPGVPSILADAVFCRMEAETI